MKNTLFKCDWTPRGEATLISFKSLNIQRWKLNWSWFVEDNNYLAKIVKKFVLNFIQEILEFFSWTVALSCNFVFLLFILRFSSYSTNKTSINKKKDIQRSELSCSASPVLLSASQPSSGKTPTNLTKTKRSCGKRLQAWLLLSRLVRMLLWLHFDHNWSH